MARLEFILCTGNADGPSLSRQRNVFASVRHRTLSKETAQLMAFKLVTAAAKIWRRLQGKNLLLKVIQGTTFRDVIKVTNTASQNAA
ncbi:hypothetical protein ACFSBS_12605 [Azospirillum griseum]|uniref:Uncharacterized protein n=1 Tax=Azospirillum griseum TaxID=2496639 RepID=A0A3S0HU58_9PROT|nr:hypothetical protein EJ903_22840 [Azospirillum griseum]